MRILYALCCLMALAFTSTQAQASLTSFKSYNGKYAVSTDGFGTNNATGTGVISAGVQSGSTVVAAYLYTATWGNTDPDGFVTFEGTTLSYDTFVPNATACCSLASARADVTSIVKAAIDGGPGGVYDFDIAETGRSGNIDGHGLVVVYGNPALPEASVGIFDGFASVTGDTVSINFAAPLDTTNPGFFAEMNLGIGFSCCGQKSTVDVNGVEMTQNAGNYDDADDQSFGQNGRLITVGSFDDPFSPMNPSYEDDHERYDLTSFVSNGDTKIKVDTFNSSQDDNIFLATFYVSGEAGFNEPPPSQTPSVPLPATALMLMAGLGGLGLGARRRRG